MSVPTWLSVCGKDQPVPATAPALPPSKSAPVVWMIGLCFEPEGSKPRFEPEHYLHDIQLKPSLPSQARWTPYDDAAKKEMSEDYQRLWNNNALTDLSIEVRDFLFVNGVVGKLVTYNITER